MLALLTAFSILVPAPTANEPPAGPPPTLQYFKLNDKGAFEQTVTIVEAVPVTKSIVVEVNGVKETRNVTELMSVYKVVRQMVDARDFDIHGIDGKKVEDKAWKQQLSDGAIVLVAADGKFPHAAYLKPIKEGTLVLVRKQTPAPVVAPPPK